MALWIYANDRPSDVVFYYFKKTFEAKAGDRFTVDLSADTRYQFYLNGSLICDGPCQGAAHLKYYESADASRALVDGENEILVKVQYVGNSNFHIVYRKDRPALWFDGKLISGDNCTPIGSDASWLCLRDDSVKFNHFLGIHNSMPPYEEWLEDEILTPVTVSNWFEPSIATNGFSPWGTIQPYSLHKRPIPQMKEHPARAMTAVKQGEGYVIYDAGEYTTAKVYLTLNAPKGSTVKATYAECCSFGQPTGAAATDKRVRDDIMAEGSRIDGCADIIHARGGKQTYTSFWFRAFRYIKLEYGAECEVEAPMIGDYFYPLDEAGSFACSNELYEKMWHVSRNTLLCCTHETYVDCPYYEQGQYSMDGALEMLYTFRASSDRQMPLKFLSDLAASQTPEGMICANYPTSVTQIIPDFTLFWVLAVRDYLRYTGDVKSVASFMGTVDKALEAFEVLKNDKGLIGPTKYWAYVDWVPGWLRGVPHHGDKSPLTVTCLMYAAALRAASELAITLGRSTRAKDYLERAEEMAAAVKANCYDSEAGLFRDTPDYRFFSQHTTVWAVLSGAVTGEEAGALVDRTFQSTEKVEKCTFSMNHYFFRALEKANRYCYAPALFEGWEKMLALHCTTWCENPDKPRSECHAWSSAPTYEFSAMVLGVYPTSDGYDTVRIKPEVKSLPINWARGSVPTVKGEINVDWSLNGSFFSMEVTLPEGVTATVVLPDGSVEEGVSGSKKITCDISK